MSENKTPTFRFSDEDFVRSAITVKLPVDPDKPEETEDVTFREFSKKNFEKFVMEVFNINSYENPEAEEKDRKRKPFDKLSQEVSEPLCRWLAVSSGKDVKYFEKLQDSMSIFGFGRLLDVLSEVNHVEAILATGGNLSMLPMVTKIMDEVTQ